MNNKDEPTSSRTGKIGIGWNKQTLEGKQYKIFKIHGELYTVFPNQPEKAGTDDYDWIVYPCHQNPRKFSKNNNKEKNDD